MTRTIVNNAGEIPAPTTADIGDEIFSNSDGTRSVFIDVSKSTSYSYTFDGNSGIIADSSVTDHFDSSKIFGAQFSTYIENQNNSPLLSFSLDSVKAVVRAEPSSLTIQKHGDSDKNVVGLNPWTDNNTIDSNQIERKSGSYYFTGKNHLSVDSAGKGFIDATDAEDSFKSTMPYTLHAYVHDNGGTSIEQPIVRTKSNSLVWKQNELIVHNVHHKLLAYDSATASPNQSMSTLSSGEETVLKYTTINTNNISNNKTWEHNALVDDGYDRTIFKQGTRYHAVPDNKYVFSNGSLRYNDFFRDKDASFSAKVFFPSSTSANATLFTMGNGTGNITSLVYNNSTGNLEVKCKQISKNISMASFLDASYKVVSWDIRVNPGRIRVWINDSCIVSENASGGAALTDYTWASGVGGGVLETITPSGTTFQPIHTINSYNTLNSSALSIDNGNLYFNSTLNDVSTYFLLNNLLGNNKTYYFEMEYIPFGEGWDYKTYTQLVPHIVNSGWDGTHTYPSDEVAFSGGESFWAHGYENYHGAHLWQYTDHRTQYNPASNPGGDKFFIQRYPWISGGWYMYKKRTLSYFADFTNGIMFSLQDGHPNTTSPSWAIVPENTHSLNYNLGGATNRQTYYGSVGGVAGKKFTPNYTLNETTYKIAWSSIGTSNYAAAWSRGTTGSPRRWIRRVGHDIEIRFNPDTWKYDPTTLIIDVIKPLIDNKASFMGSGTVYPITGLPVNGFFASGDLIDDWFVPSSTPYFPLKYYPHTTFKPLSNQPLVIGEVSNSINEDKTAGSAFAAEWVAKHSGSTTTINSGDVANNDLTNTINSASDGTAILLGPGSYRISAKDAGYFSIYGISSAYTASSIFLGKKILICGNTNNPSSVVIDYCPYYLNNYYGVFSFWDNAADEKTGLAFCKVKRDLSAFAHDPPSATILQPTLHYYSKGGFANKVIFDFHSHANDLDPKPSNWTDSNQVPNSFQKGFLYAYDDTDIVGIKRRNRSFTDCFFTGYKTEENMTYYASTNSLVDRLNLHNISYSGRIPSDYADHHTGNTIQSANASTGSSFNETVVDGYITFDDSTASLPKFKGYINGLDLRKHVGIDSADFYNVNRASTTALADYKHDLNKKSDDSIGMMFDSDRDDPTFVANRSFRLVNIVENKQLVRFDDTGKLFVAKQGRMTHVATVPISLSTWTHVRMVWDPSDNTIRVAKDGAAGGDSFSGFFDSHYINHTRLNIAASEQFGDGTIERDADALGIKGKVFDRTYLSNQNSIKDLEIIDSNILSEPKPTADLTSRLKTRLLTANNNGEILSPLSKVAGQTATDVASIDGLLFSPYLDSDRGFFVQSIALPGFTASALGNPYGSHSTYSAYNNTDFLLTYKDSVFQGITDSPDLQVLATLARFDEDGDSIGWNYSIENFPPRFVVGRTDSGYDYQIKKYDYNYINNKTDSANLKSGFHSMSIIKWTPYKIGKDSLPNMLYLPNDNRTIQHTGISLSYDRFGAELLEEGMIHRYITIKPFDSDHNQSISIANGKKIFYTDSDELSKLSLSDSVNIKSYRQLDFMVDSLGALP